MSELTELESALGLSFSDKSLLQRALVHRSYLNEHPGFPLESNERLEFLGDAVLGFLTGEHLYHRFPELAEGPLTNLRAALVRREALAGLARQFELGRYLLMSIGEDASGGRERSANLCGVFEALVGAMYLDQGLSLVQRFLEPLIGPAAARVQQEHSDRDYKSRLQELAQERLRLTPHYTTVTESGPDHAKRFTVQVHIGDLVYGEGVGSNKQQAAQSAAQQGLARLRAQSFGEAPAGPVAHSENGRSEPAEHTGSGLQPPS